MLLTANVSLLAIQSLDNSSGTSNRSFVQIASYVSLLLSLFNYIACQVLLRQHRKITNSTAVSSCWFSLPCEYQLTSPTRLYCVRTCTSSGQARTLSGSKSWQSFSASPKDYSRGGTLVYVFLDGTSPLVAVCLPSS